MFGWIIFLSKSFVRFVVLWDVVGGEEPCSVFRRTTDEIKMFVFFLCSSLFNTVMFLFFFPRLYLTWHVLSLTCEVWRLEDFALEIWRDRSSYAYMRLQSVLCIFLSICLIILVSKPSYGSIFLIVKLNAGLHAPSLLNCVFKVVQNSVMKVASNVIVVHRSLECVQWIKDVFRPKRKTMI